MGHSDNSANIREMNGGTSPVLSYGFLFFLHFHVLFTFGCGSEQEDAAHIVQWNSVSKWTLDIIGLTVNKKKKKKESFSNSGAATHFG